MTGMECFLETFHLQPYELFEERLKGSKLLEVLRRARSADQAGLYIESRMLLEEALQLATADPALEGLILEMARSARPADPGGGNYGGNYGGGNYGGQQSGGQQSSSDDGCSDCVTGACLGLLLQAICEGGC